MVVQAGTALPPPQVRKREGSAGAAEVVADGAPAGTGTREVPEARPWDRLGLPESAQQPIRARAVAAQVAAGLALSPAGLEQPAEAAAADERRLTSTTDAVEGTAPRPHS